MYTPESHVKYKLYRAKTVEI